jgi:hypothetical protein
MQGAAALFRLPCSHPRELEPHRCTDLSDLRLLKSAVLDSECIILVQSAGVLERPWCLVELTTAIDARIPIIGVSLSSGKHSYDFGEASHFLKSLDKKLEERNPGSTALLINHDCHPSDVMWKLSWTLPSIISVAFNPSASSNVLRAVIADIISGMRSARPIEMAAKEDWLRQRRVSASLKSGTVAAVAAVAPQQQRQRAPIPPEVPELPAALQLRSALLAALKEKVLTQAGSTALVAAPRKSAAATAAHGMGGVGKTTAAVQLVRDPEVAVAFEKLVWITVSAEPDLIALLRTMHVRLTGKKLPESQGADEVMDGCAAVRAAAKGIRALVVLDDVWEGQHAELLNNVDAEAGSAVVITTRMRNIVGGEVSCGLLSLDESLSLLLTSAGLADLISHPPPAALEACEICGRLALALPIAGGMIRELQELWTTELVPMLKEELGAEISAEERIVNASFRCVGPSQRAGVEALFTCFAAFAEDEAVPIAVLDVLAPLICERAGASPSRPHVQVRRWLSQLLRSSLLVEQGAGHVSVHDLIRDVMISRAEAAVGRLVGLQRDVVRLFLAAFDEGATNKAIKRFIIKSLRHHVAHAQHPDVLLRNDQLLLSALAHSDTTICGSAGRSIGLERLLSEATASEAAGAWWESARLSFAAATIHGQLAGVELIRAWHAIGQMQETEASMALESRVLNLLGLVTEGGFVFGSPEHKAVTNRAKELGELALAAASDMTASDADLFERVLGWSNFHWHEAFSLTGVMVFQGDLTQELLSKAYAATVLMRHGLQVAARVAPDVARTDFAAQYATNAGVLLAQLHMLPEFDKTAFFGENGSLLSAHIARYDFSTIHDGQKNSNIGVDQFLIGTTEVGILLFWGDLEAAQAGWVKKMDAWRKVEASVETGERKWAEYNFEDLTSMQAVPAGALAAGDTEFLRTFIKRMPSVIALGHSDVAAELSAPPINWEGPEGLCFLRPETRTLQARALAALVAEDIDPASLRTWLPRPQELLYIAQHEATYQAMICGAAHPSLLCARLYTDYLGGWDEAAEVADGFLAMPTLKTQPLTRIESWRLLARCRGARGDGAAACEALECGVEEARTVGYVWMECKALEDMLVWIQGDEDATRRVKERLAAASAAAAPAVGRESGV